MRLVSCVILAALLVAVPSLASAQDYIGNMLRQYEQLERIKARGEARPREQEAHEAEMAELAARIEAIRANTDYLKARTAAANAALEKVTEKTAEVETPDQIDQQRRAEQGDAAAQHALGLMYAHGLGVQEDDAKAVTWFRQAAEQDHGFAQYALGLMYARGEGVPEDDTEAVTWYRKAAEQGHGFAQYALGEMYAVGHGVPQDNVEAHMWLNLAASLSSGEQRERTVTTRDRVAERMTPADLGEAQRRAREWHAAHQG